MWLNEFARLIQPKYYVSYDIVIHDDTWGAIWKTDFLKSVPNEIYRPLLLGFNPPYGYRSETAKEFIEYSYKVWKPEFVCWLVPGSCRKLLHSLYEPIHQSITKESFLDVKNERQMQQTVLMFIGKCRENPIPIAKRIVSHVTIQHTHGVPVKEEVQFIVRRVGAKAPFPIFHHSGNNSWNMYKSDGSLEVFHLDEDRAIICGYLVKSSAFMKMSGFRSDYEQEKFLNVVMKRKIELNRNAQYYKPPNVTHETMHRLINEIFN